MPVAIGNDKESLKGTVRYVSVLGQETMVFGTRLWYIAAFGRFRRPQESSCF